jgi:hypothetical protein
MDVASLTDVSRHRATSKRFVTIYEFNVCPAAPLKSLKSYPAQPQHRAEVEFLEEIQTEVLRVFLLAIHRHLY